METTIERFQRLWIKTFPGSQVPLPTSQQLLGTVLVILDHDEGGELWAGLTKLIKEAYYEQS